MNQNLKRFLSLRDDLIEMQYSFLTKQQFDAVIHGKGPGVVLAVPGSGKTTIIINRIHYLITYGPVYKTTLLDFEPTLNCIENIESHLNLNVPLTQESKQAISKLAINPNNLLSLTFSRASAKDMDHRFYERFKDVPVGAVKFSTIHSFAFSLVREYAQKKRIRYTLIEGGNSDINKNIIIKNIYKKVNNAVINDDKLDELLNSIGFVKNKMINILDFENYNNFNIPNFKQIFTMYETFKQKNNYIDFDDMLTLCLYILKNDSFLRDKYRHKYKYIQVDEGQDTSHIQNQIIKMLAHPLNNLLVVADDDQSIYGFRGASPEYLLEFDKHYDGAKKVFMDKNFRSSKKIVTLCNQFISSNKIRHKKNITTDNDEGIPVKIIHFKDEIQQINFVVDQLKDIKDLSNTAILYRNNISSISLAEILNRNDISFYIKDSKHMFFKHWVLNDLKAFFHLSTYPNDLNAFEKIYFKMNAYISKNSLIKLKSSMGINTIFESLLSFPDLKSFQIKNLKRIQRVIEELKYKRPFEGIMDILYELEYDKYLRDNCKKFGYSYDNIKIVLSSIQLIAKSSSSLDSFLSRFEELENIISNSKYNRFKSLTLSTLHSSKGLEFENVFMIDLINGDFPSTSSIEAFEEGDLKPLEEERRLFYVGMTRAKTNLYLTSMKFRNDEAVYQSKFLDEVNYICELQTSSEFSSDLSVGKIINHKKFGKGKIKRIYQSTIEIEFNNSDIRRFDINTALKNEIIYF